MYNDKLILLFNYLIKYIPRTINDQVFTNKKIDFFFLKQLDILFILPSINENRHKFIIILILIEKLYNNKVIFLMDKRTLSKSIKIGCYLNIDHEFLIDFMFITSFHTLPKFNENNIILNINNIEIISYTLKKIISNIIFNLDKDINIYYDYLGEFKYLFYLIFRSKINSILHNQLTMNLYGISFFNQEMQIHNQLIENGWFEIRKKELEDNSDTEYEELEEYNNDTENNKENIIIDEYNEETLNIYKYMIDEIKTQYEEIKYI
jgi:hypothetical protein